MRALTKILVSICILVIGIATINYVLVHRHMSAVLDQDPRNVGILMWSHYQYYVIPGTLVIDIRKVSGTNSPADVFRVLLQFASTQKDTTYSRVVLSHRSKAKFLLEGDYFKQLGSEFGDQNPVYTMRTFSEHLYSPDGTAAFGTWTGGLLGVLGKQLEDFGEFHKRWYNQDLTDSGG